MMRFGNGCEVAQLENGQLEDQEGFRTCSLTKKKKVSWTCVSVRQSDSGVEVRNSNDPNKLTTHFTDEEWQNFVAGVKRGEFDF